MLSPVTNKHLSQLKETSRSKSVQALSGIDYLKNYSHLTSADHMIRLHIWRMYVCKCKTTIGFNAKKFYRDNRSQERKLI